MRKSLDQPLVHEKTYQGVGPASFVARRRLSRTLDLVNSLDIPVAGEMADFGCSNGFVLSVLQAGPMRGKRWSYHGFDRSERLLSLAREKNLPDTEFQLFDLNVLSEEWTERFDLVTCFETLEHTGNFRNAVLNLVDSCRSGGRILISIPNENGVPGLLKLCGRTIVRSNPYGDFFEGKSRARYVWRLVSHGSIDDFRTPPAEGWGPHLGFDSGRFAEFIQESLVAAGRCRIVSVQASRWMFNHFYVLEKVR